MTPSSQPATAATAAAATSTLAQALLSALAPTPPPTSVFVSPASVACALALLQAGAKPDSASAAQLASTLGGGPAAVAALTATALADAAPASGPTISCANGVWAPKGVTFGEGYLKEVAKLGAVARPLTSAADVNAWVSAVTRGRIPSIVPDDVAARAVVVLANALYFKGAWAIAFDPRASRPLRFALTPTTTIAAHGMRRLCKGVQYAANASLAGAIRLPYAGGGHEAVVALPHDATTPPAATLAAVETADAAPTNDGTGWMVPLAGVALTLPKFSAEWGGDLKAALAAAGVTAPFSSGADFTPMLAPGSPPPPPVSDILHKVVVDVDEAGTEAAAATAVAMTRALLSAPEDMYVDRPFLFGVRHVESRAWLFVGHVASGVAAWEGDGGAAVASAAPGGLAPPGATAAARGTEL